MAKLAHCSKLQHLELIEDLNYKSYITNISTGLAGCSSLKYLDVWSTSELTAHPASASAALPDTLQHLRGPSKITTSSPLWQSISKLPALAHLETHSLHVDSTVSTAVPAGNITHLTTVEIRVHDLPADEPLSGLLTRLLHTRAARAAH
jgi:hypothetical protein